LGKRNTQEYIYPGSKIIGNISTSGPVVCIKINSNDSFEKICKWYQKFLVGTISEKELEHLDCVAGKISASIDNSFLNGNISRHTKLRVFIEEKEKEYTVIVSKSIQEQTTCVLILLKNK
jgi:hypothetical protein